METEGTEVTQETTATTTTQEAESTTQQVSESSTDTPKETVQPSEEDQVRKRIDKIVWQREEARREAEHWKRMAQQKPAETKPEAQDPTKPRADDPRFKSYDEYTEAVAEWKVEQRIKKAQEEFNKRTEHERFQESKRAFDERVLKVREKYPDFDELFDRAPISEAMAPTILESEQGPELAVYLSKNPDVARKIYNLSPTQAARELGKIEAKLDDLLQIKAVTDAPAPLRPVRPKGEGSTDPDDKDDIKTWMRKRNKQLGR